nr:MAG TPA: hypothetical protein [Caudoviricetes sp.]
MRLWLSGDTIILYSNILRIDAETTPAYFLVGFIFSPFLFKSAIRRGSALSPTIKSLFRSIKEEFRVNKSSVES